MNAKPSRSEPQPLSISIDTTTAVKCYILKRRTNLSTKPHLNQLNDKLFDSYSDFLKKLYKVHIEKKFAKASSKAGKPTNIDLCLYNSRLEQPQAAPQILALTANQ